MADELSQILDCPSGGVAAAEAALWEYEQVLGWPWVDGREVTDEHRQFCAEHGHAPNWTAVAVAAVEPRCARCGGGG